MVAAALPDSVYDEVLTRLAEGRSLSDVCRDHDMPSREAVYSRINANAEYADKYARATVVRADALVDEMFDIANNGRNDWMAREDPDNAGYEFNGEHVQRSRLRVDTLKWAAARMAPKKWGDRIQHTGEGGGPVQTEDVGRAKLAAALDAIAKRS